MSTKAITDELFQAAKAANLAIARRIAVPHHFRSLRAFMIELGESEEFFDRWAVEKGYKDWKDFIFKATIDGKSNFSNSLDLALKAKEMYEDSIQD